VSVRECARKGTVIGVHRHGDSLAALVVVMVIGIPLMV